MAGCGTTPTLYRGNTQHWSILRNHANITQEGSRPPAHNDVMQIGEVDEKTHDRKRDMRNVDKHNEYSQRARENFQYWLIERPKPTQFGKYGMGSYKTVLGIGNAPRT